MSNLFEIKTKVKLSVSHSTFVTFEDEHNNFKGLRIADNVLDISLFTCTIGNHNKFYELYCVTGRHYYVISKYGAIGSKAREHCYPFNSWEKQELFRNKVRQAQHIKGYTEHLDLHSYITIAGKVHNICQE